MMKLLALLTGFLSVTQATESRPSQFGSVGQSLTGSEVVQITDLANATGRPPWLLIGFPSMMFGVETVSVYLEPEGPDATVRRGRVLTLSADTPPRVRERSVWRLKDTRPYAYIVAPGHRRGEMIDERDISWPFVLLDEIDDETLISVVAFVRSRPAIPGLPEAAAPRNVSNAPIAGVAREDDSLIVALRTSEATGERVTVTRRSGEWVITHFESWIV